MADGISVKIIGPDLAMLATMVNAKVVAAAEEDLDRIATLVQADAKANCPVAQDPKKGEIPGTLRDDIQVYSSNGNRQIGNMNVYYSLYVHNGTWKMKARPYLFNANEANKSKWISIIQSNPGV